MPNADSLRLTRCRGGCGPGSHLCDVRVRDTPWTCEELPDLGPDLRDEQPLAATTGPPAATGPHRRPSVRLGGFPTTGRHGRKVKWGVGVGVGRLRGETPRRGAGERGDSVTRPSGRGKARSRTEERGRKRESVLHREVAPFPQVHADPASELRGGRGRDQHHPAGAIGEREAGSATGDTRARRGEREGKVRRRSGKHPFQKIAYCTNIPGEVWGERGPVCTSSGGEQCC
jgi:hypothetical protein